MRIAIVGAGALGSAFGAGFVRAGHDVTLIDVSAALVDTLNTNGITIVDGAERSTLAALISKRNKRHSIGPLNTR